MLSRRSIVGALLAAPIVVKTAPLMRCAPTSIIKPPPPILRLRWRVPFVLGDTACVRIGDHERFYTCVETGFGEAAAFVENQPMPARFHVYHHGPGPGSWPNGELSYAS